MYIYNHESKMPSRLSPQWLCGNSWMTLDYLYVCIYIYIIYIYIYIYIYWRKYKLIDFLTCPTPAKLDFFFSTLCLSSLNWKATVGFKFSCLGLQQSVPAVDNIMQAIWIIYWVMLLCQKLLPIYKIGFWCELTIASTYLGKCRSLFWSKIYIDV